MSYTTHYKVSILGALISSIAFTALAVFAIAPGETLDPVGDTLCAGPNDPTCIINPYDGLDPNSVLYLDGNGDITTDALFSRTDDFFFIGTETLNPGYRNAVSLNDALGNGFFIGSSMLHESDSSDGFNIVFNGDASNLGLSDQTTLLGYLDLVNNQHAFSAFEPDGIRNQIQIIDSFGDAIRNIFLIGEEGINIESQNTSDSFQSRILVNHSDGILFEYDGTSGYTFPRTDGGAGEVLATDGSGQLSWVTPTGGSGSPSGNNTEIQFNESGSFGANQQFTFDPDTSKFWVKDTSIIGNTALLIDPDQGFYAIGDHGTGNQTRITIRDTIGDKNIQMNADNGLTVSGSVNTGMWLDINPTSEIASIGDLNSLGNNTYFKIDDANQAITFGYGSDTYTFPVGKGGAGQVLTDVAGDGTLSWETPSGGGSSLFTLLGTNLFDNRSGNGTMTGVGNFFVGTGAGALNDTGNHNIFLGNYSGAANTSGNHNIFNGYQSGYTNTTGANNIFSGQNAGYSNTTGDNNIFSGQGAGQSNTTGSNNIFSGYLSGSSNTTGAYNIFSGYLSGSSNTEGSNNIFFGQSAGILNTTGSENIFLGASSGYLNTTGSANIFFGSGAGTANTTGSFNLFSGHYAGQSNTEGSYNIFSGYYAGQSNTTGHDNIFSGYHAGYSNTTGGNNIFSGYYAGYSNTTGGNNIFSGTSAGYSNTTGSDNIFSGLQAGYSNTTGYFNIFSGYNAGQSNTEGSSNVFSGFQAGYSNTTGSSNIFSGYLAGYSNTEGSDNIFFGQYAGNTNVTGSFNVVIGYDADVATDSTTNAIALGATAIAASNEFALPDSITTWKFQGDSYTLPTAYPGASGYVLSSTDAGVLSWAAAGGGGGGDVSLVGVNSFASSISEQGIGTGLNLILIGEEAGADLVSGASGSNFFGPYSGYQALNAGFSNFFGGNAGALATDASESNFLGYFTGRQATNATRSNFFGSYAGYQASNASESNFVGYQAGQSAQNASNSIFIGSNAGFSATNAAYSIFIGQNAGALDSVDNTSLGASILIGKDTSTAGYSDSIAIGAGATNTASNQFMIGSAGSPIDEMIIVGNGASCAIDNNIYGDGSTGLNCSSDERLKTNITGLSSVLETLQNIETVTYNWKANPNGNQQIGFIAQNLEQYFPEMVREGHDGYLQVNYATMTPILTKAIQELDLKLVDIQTLSDETFLSRMRNWFADAGNGITKFFAKEIYTEQICVAKSDGTDFCINGDQLESVMNGSGNQIIYTSNNNNQNDSGDTDEPIIGESSNNEVIEENGDSSDSEPQMDVDGETGVDTATNTDASPSEDQSIENTTSAESSSESTAGADSSSESGDAGADSGAESGAGIDE